MIIFSSWDWDTPPGTGYITVGIITISAILTVIMTLWAPQRRAGESRTRIIIQARSPSPERRYSLLGRACSQTHLFGSSLRDWLTLLRMAILVHRYDAPDRFVAGT